MAQTVDCPGCEKQLNLPDTAAGKKVKCSACESVSRIHADESGSLFLELLEDPEFVAESPRAPVSAGARQAPRRGGGPQSGRELRSNRAGGGRPPEGATAVFVFGLLSLILCPVLGPIAWYMGSDYSKKCSRARVRPDSLGSAGMIMGIIGSVLLVLTIVYVAVVGALIMPEF